MRKPLALISGLVLLMVACNQTGDLNSSLLSPESLPLEYFTVAIDRDTTLHTKKGALIHIPRGALSKRSGRQAKLVIREAYSFTDIVRAGLITESNGMALSSGGMVYIDAAEGEEVSITGAIEMAIPAEFIEEKMLLYKGEEKPDGHINWTDTFPLKNNPQLDAINTGHMIFQSNCARCHSITEDLAGPKLLHTDKQRLLPGNAVDRFILNGPRVLAEGNAYYLCLYKKYYGTPMPAFPLLTKDSLDYLFAYIANESNRSGLPVPEWNFACWDSCSALLRLTNPLLEKRASLIDDNEDMVTTLRWDSTGTRPIPNGGGCTDCPLEKVIPPTFPAMYYQFKVESFGWYNIDVLLDELPNVEESSLTVKATGGENMRFSIYLAIPFVKVFQEGGPLNSDPLTYGFLDVNGKLPLPQNTEAWVFAIGDNGKDEIIFGKISFTTSISQDLVLNLSTISREQLQQEFSSMQLDQVKLNVYDPKNAAAIRKLDKQLTELEKLKPKNCNCDCAITDRDTTFTPASAL